MNDIHVGIPKPDLGAGREEWQQSLNEMRALISRARHRDSALVRMCMERAEVDGLNGEDTMTLIAYYALRQLEDASRQLSIASMEALLYRPSPQKAPKS